LPIYQYRCLECLEEYEKREGFHAPSTQQCPVCGGTARRVLHAPPIIFKGSGFYVTDNRPGGNGASESTPAAKPTESKAGESTDSEAH
jgi:putative FmdB family regulatory protein